MFPIVFAAISGRSMKMIARYLAERGAKLSVRMLHYLCQVFFGRSQLTHALDPRTTDGQSVRLGNN
jgi:hypothetical protein